MKKTICMLGSTAKQDRGFKKKVLKLANKSTNRQERNMNLHNSVDVARCGVQNCVAGLHGDL